MSRHLRLESVDNAFEQGSTVAHNMLGTQTMHDKAPWIWCTGPRVIDRV